MPTHILRWGRLLCFAGVLILRLTGVADAASGVKVLTPVSMPFDATIMALNEPTSSGDLMFRVTVTPLEPIAVLTIQVRAEGNLQLTESLDRELRDLAPGTPVSFDGTADILGPGAGAIQLGVQLAPGSSPCAGPLGLGDSYALYLLDDGAAVSTGQSSIVELRLLRIGGLLAAGLITGEAAQVMVEDEILRAAPTPEDERVLTSRSPRAAAGVRIEGTARWTDGSGGIHPARSAVVRAFVPGLLFGLSEVASVTADRSGRFVIDLPAGTVGADPTDLTVRVYSQNFATNVRTPPVLVLFGADTYFRERVFTGVMDGTMLAGELFTAGNADDAGRAFSIADGVVVGSDYMETVQGARPASIRSNFPRPGTGTASFYDGSSLNIHPSKPFAWDVILHEYGHYLGDLFDFDESPGGAHMCNENLVASRGKDPGTKLSWSEGVATYLGIAAQIVTGAASLGVPLAGDTAYDSISATTGVAWSYDLETRDLCVGIGEGSETNVSRALWDLADAAVDGDDEIALGHAAVWASIAGSHPVTMSAAWNAAIAGRIPREIVGYGKGFAQNRISPSQTSPEDGAVLEEAPPDFQWLKNGLDEFRVVFFDASFIEVADSGDLGDVASWTPPQSTWDTIRAADSPVTWVVQGKHTESPETGTYWSGDRTLGGVDFAFVIDDTGSMSEEIGGVRSALLSFLSGFDPTSTDLTFQLTTFKDDVTVRVPTNDLATIQAQVSGLGASGGDDCPENSLAGLSQGTAAVRRGGTVLFATDADPRPGGDLGSLITELQSRGARVNVLLSGTCFGGSTLAEVVATRSSTQGQSGGVVVPRGAFLGAIDAYSQIASATGGTFAYVPEVNATSDGQIKYHNTAVNILAAAVGPRTVLVTPSVTPVGATATVTLYGQNTRFGASSVVSFGDGVEVLGARAVDPLTIEAEIRVADSAILGFRDIEVQTVIAAGVTETALGVGALNLVARPGAGTLVSAVPPVAIQGTDVLVEVDGIGTTFVDGETVLSLGSGVLVSMLEVVSSSRLRASVSVDPAAAIGFRSVTTTTGGVVTRALVSDFFRVQAPAPDVPRVLAVKPSAGQQGRTLEITLNLADFETDGDGAAVEITGGGVTVKSVRGCGAVLEATVVIAADATPTVRDVVVRAGGRQAVGINAFTVTALPSGDVTLPAIKDTLIRATSKDRNEGANPTLRVTGRTTRILVGFEGSSIPRDSVHKARLVLTIVEGTTQRWLGRGRQVAVYPVSADWVEGDGKALDLPAIERTRGNGPGATWLCAAARDIAKRDPDCASPWKGAGPLLSATDIVQHTLGVRGAVEWDVTSDVQHGVSAWVLNLIGDQGRVRYYSREGASSSEAVPHLIVERE